jgi:uncharacterized protein with PQ loop repeat
MSLVQNCTLCKTTFHWDWHLFSAELLIRIVIFPFHDDAKQVVGRACCNMLAFLHCSNQYDKPARTVLILQFTGPFLNIISARSVSSFRFGPCNCHYACSCWLIYNILHKMYIHYIYILLTVELKAKCRFCVAAVYILHMNWLIIVTYLLKLCWHTKFKDPKLNRCKCCSDLTRSHDHLQ